MAAKGQKRRVFLGIDAGGTKTVCVVADEHGNLLGYGQAGPANYQVVGLEKATKMIVSAAQAALASVGATTKPEFAVLGLAGVGRAPDRERFEQILPTTPVFRETEFFVTSDAHIALVGAVGEEYGVGVIAGTGAIAFGINRYNKIARADGWGYRLGDEGGGYWIGQEALRALLRAYDGRGDPTALQSYLLKELGLSKIEDLVEWAYSERFSVARIASLAPSVFAAAAVGDKIAIRLLRQAGRALGRAAVAVIRKLDLANEPFPFVTLGGLFRGEPKEPLVGPIQKMVKAVAPKARWLPPQFPPEIGAVIIGLSRKGLFSPVVLRNLSRTFKEFGKRGF